MKDDIERQLIDRYYPVTYCPTEVELQDLLLEDLELILAKNGVTINNYNLPQRSLQYRSNMSNHLIQEELDYNIHYLEERAKKFYQQLNKEQKEVFHSIVNSVINKEPNFFFIYPVMEELAKLSYGTQLSHI